jgi:hypothetical protein
MPPVSRQASVLQWRVLWDRFGLTRVSYFDSEDDARTWFNYVLNGWGPDATASIACRAVPPWELVEKCGPTALDAENARTF